VEGSVKKITFFEKESPYLASVSDASLERRMPSCAVWPDHLTSMHIGEIEVDERDREIAVRDQIDRGEANGSFVIDHENAGCTPLHLTTLKRGTTRPVVSSRVIVGIMLPEFQVAFRRRAGTPRLTRNELRTSACRGGRARLLFF
jgi:hypothetical protein